MFNKIKEFINNRKEIKTGYKIVLKRKKQLLSCIEYDLDGKTIYKKHRKVKRKEGYGPLAVFKHFEDAIDFGLIKTNKLFKIKYKKSKYNYLWTKDTITESYYLPHGTKFADWVKLKKCIKVN